MKANGLFEAVTQRDGIIRGDRSVCLQGGVHVALGREAAPPQICEWLPPCTVMKLRLTCAKKTAVKRGSACGLPHHFSAEIPIPSQSHLEEIDSPFTSPTHTTQMQSNAAALPGNTKRQKMHIWCPGRGTLLRCWSDINCTQIKMDLAPVAGSLIHSDAAAGKIYQESNQTARFHTQTQIRCREAANPTHAYYYIALKIPHNNWKREGLRKSGNCKEEEGQHKKMLQTQQCLFLKSLHISFHFRNLQNFEKVMLCSQCMSRRPLPMKSLQKY